MYLLQPFADVNTKISVSLVCFLNSNLVFYSELQVDGEVNA